MNKLKLYWYSDHFTARWYDSAGKRRAKDVPKTITDMSEAEKWVVDWHTKTGGILPPNASQKRKNFLQKAIDHMDFGGSIGKHGYKIIQTPHGQDLDHRYRMELWLGRELLPGENVHHKNGNKTDNRICNLELWSKSQPCGQRVEDKIEWASEILATYAPTKLANSRPKTDPTNDAKQQDEKPSYFAWLVK